MTASRNYWYPVVILLTVMSLYGGFLGLPFVFDDNYFFTSGVADSYLDINNFSLSPRYVVYLLHAITLKWFGPGTMILREQGMFWHAAVAIAIFFFLNQVQRCFIDQYADQSSALIPLLAAMIFALHPAAVYAAAYLNQRTIVMATFFAILTWVFILKGLYEDNRRWMLWSVLTYAISVLCKEHAVMVPVVGAVLGVWWTRLHKNSSTVISMAYQYRWILFLYIIIALFAVFSKTDVLAYTYEPDATYSIGKLGLHNPWLLSVITQGFLFFKYLILWVMPNPLWMSVYMREPFAYTWMSWPQTFGFALFILWPIIGIRMVLFSGTRAIVGFAMLSPWILFATELSTVRFVDIFVLYRSYLWLAPAFVVFLLLEKLVRSKAVLVALFLFPLILFPLAFNRISTFAHPFFLWDDAVRLIEAQGREKLQGAERAYYNRAVEFQRIKDYRASISDFSKAISINSEIYIAYAGRAISYAELKEFDKAFEDYDVAMRYLPKYPMIYENKSRMLKQLDRLEESEKYHAMACGLGWKIDCPQGHEQRRADSIPRQAF